jgi:hypothetical protein
LVLLALQFGAAECLSKPFGNGDNVLHALEHFRKQ